jgi:Protein of unknown function (DUF2793)
MSDTSPFLALPLLMPSQNDKHITHNEALLRLEALVHLSVEEAASTAPPVAPIEGERRLIGASASGVFAGRSGQVAHWRDGGWHFATPRRGWLAHVATDGRILVHDGTQWVDLKVARADTLGIATPADATNRLAVAAPATLFTHVGDDHRIKVNKAGSANSASVLFQSAWSGRAEFGLTGDDRFHLKVSPDGTTWSEALVADPATGRVGIATAAPSVTLHVNGLVRLAALAKASLPAPADAGAGALVVVSDEAGGATLAFSDGTDWRRVTDRAVVS